jgi:hypothetical protein
LETLTSKLDTPEQGGLFTIEDTAASKATGLNSEAPIVTGVVRVTPSISRLTRDS